MAVKSVSVGRYALGHLKELGVIAGAYFAYMFVRKVLIADIETVSFDNAILVTAFEVTRGFFWEANWQAWAVENSKALVVFLNWVYIITFWPIIITTGLIIYIRDRRKYHYYRSVVLLSFVFALIVFALFPLAPPRFLPEHGFLDTIQRFGPTWYGGRDMAFFYNAFAAMPSLHFGWTVLFGVLFFRMKHIWLKPLGIIYPTMTFFAITVTGNHYIIDAVVGAAVITTSFLVYEAALRLKPHSPPVFALAKSYLSVAFAYLYGSVLRWKPRASLALTGAKSYLRVERFASMKWRPAFAIHRIPVKPKRI